MSTPDALSEDTNRPPLSLMLLLLPQLPIVLRRCEVSSSNKWWMEEELGEDCSFANTSAAV